MTNLTFYGGINEIGGNKILLEDKGTRVFLDFGMQMGKANKYFAEFSNPRKLNGFGDLFEFDLLPDIKGIYRRDYSKHTGYGDHKQDTTVDGVLLTHAHVDHCAYIHYLRPEIPIYCSEASKLIMQGFQDMGSNEEYVTYKESFQTYENSKGGLSRAVKPEHREVIPRNIQVINPSKTLKLDSISVEPILIDHSLPGVFGFLIHTSEGDIGYTADIRFHGRTPENSQKFVDVCGSDNPDYLLCEGTRIVSSDDKTEFDVENDSKKIIERTKGLVVCTYPARDLDRFLSFYNAAKSTGRNLVIDPRQAYLLDLFKKSDQWNSVYPSSQDPHISVFISRKYWGLVDRDPNIWTENLIESDYKPWERPFLNYPNRVDYRDISAKQNDYIFYCSDFQLQNLIDVRPVEGSAYIRSSTEPFDDEMKLDHERIKRWLVHFGLLTSEADMERIHVSGHGSRAQIKRVIDGSNPGTLVPIHTQHEDEFYKLHGNVRKVNLQETLEIG